MKFTSAMLRTVVSCLPIMAVSACLAFAISQTTSAQQADPPPAPPTPPAQDDQSKKQDQDAAKDQPSSLDDLLGIDEDEKDQSGAAAAAKDDDEELKRRLNEAEIADNFSLAVEKMAISAELLDVRFDTGLGTQRVQQEIIKRLETLIEQAKKQQSQSRSSSSSSSSSSQQNRNQQQNPGQQNTQNNQQQNQNQNRQPSAGDTQEGDPPPMQEGDINTTLEESRSEWGNLPPRVRDQLMQGRREKFSSLYERLTQEYYKRLAEEGTP